MARTAKAVQQVGPTNSVLVSRPHYVWLTPEQLVVKYGHSKTFWYLRRADGTGPEFFVLGPRTIVYREDIVIEWFNAHQVQSISDPKYRELSPRKHAAFQIASGQRDFNKKDGYTRRLKRISQETGVFILRKGRSIETLAQFQTVKSPQTTKSLIALILPPAFRKAWVPFRYTKPIFQGEVKAIKLFSA